MAAGAISAWLLDLQPLDNPRLGSVVAGIALLAGLALGGLGSSSRGSGREWTAACKTDGSRLCLYPRLYPQAGRDPPELAGAHRNNRTQSEPAGQRFAADFAGTCEPSSLPPDDRLTAMGRSLDDDRAATTFTNPGTSHRLATLTDARFGLAARLPEQLTWGALMGAHIGPVSCVSCVLDALGVRG